MRERERETETETERQRQRDRETDREREKERERENQHYNCTDSSLSVTIYSSAGNSFLLGEWKVAWMIDSIRWKWLAFHVRFSVEAGGRC